MNSVYEMETLTPAIREEATSPNETSPTAPEAPTIPQIPIPAHIPSPRTSLERLRQQGNSTSRAPTMAPSTPRSNSQSTKPEKRSPLANQVSSSPPSQPAEVQPAPMLTDNINMLKKARALMMESHYGTALSICYQLLEPGVHISIQAQAALIVTSFDTNPSDTFAFAMATRIVENIGRLRQEEVEPQYRTLQLLIMDKKNGTTSTEADRAIRREAARSTPPDGGRVTGAIDTDIGMHLRTQDRIQLDGANESAENGLVNGDVEGEPTSCIDMLRNKCCIVS